MSEQEKVYYADDVEKAGACPYCGSKDLDYYGSGNGYEADVFGIVCLDCWNRFPSQTVGDKYPVDPSTVDDDAIPW